MQRKKNIRALGLCSGGLDSILAALVLKEQGIHVEWISFQTPFFSSENAEKAASMTGIPLRVMDITDTYVEMLKNPRCGYGQHMNPCMDCHALMFRLAGAEMDAKGFDFLFSGEVLGQRPMSQTRPSLRYVEKHSGYREAILRPLSALKLPETEMEKKGLVDRRRLLDLAGRGRKRQMEMANRFGISQYPTPAGGCLLTDKGFSRRLKDLFDFKENLSARELDLLKFGRHFRISETCKAVVGRTQQENDRILDLCDADSDILLKTDAVPGPIALAPGDSTPDSIPLAAAVCAGYAKCPKDRPVDVRVTIAGRVSICSVTPLNPAEARQYLI